MTDTGRIIRVDQQRRYFIIKNDLTGESVFCFHTGLDSFTLPFHMIEVGYGVRYRQIDSDKGPRAIECRVERL